MDHDSLLRKNVTHLGKLLEILEKEKCRKLVNKIRGLKHDDAVALMERFFNLSDDIRRKSNFLRRDQVDDYEKIIEIIKEKFELLGIDIPKK